MIEIDQQLFLISVLNLKNIFNGDSEVKNAETS